jgi:ATP-dependent protease ClpP protease subunit
MLLTLTHHIKRISTPQEALEFGIIDGVFKSREK